MTAAVKALISLPHTINEWRKEHLSERMFILILAFCVGLLSAVAAFILHGLIHLIQQFLMGQLDKYDANWLFLILPIVGIWLTSMFVRYVVKDNISHGITRILYAISRNQSRLKSHNCISSVIASAITIGFGGSVGAEAPIVLTGSAIGSNLGKLFKLDNHTLMVLLGCGAAGAIAGIFKAPIAGLVFTLEVLMIDLTMSSLLPILVSCVTANCFTYIFSGSLALFNFHIVGDWTIDTVPANILLGFACGMVSLYFIRTMTFCEDIFAKFANRPYIRLAIGGLTLSLLIFLFPSLYGEGYNGINLLLNGHSEADWLGVMNNSFFAGNGNMLLLYVALVILTKVVATSATNGGGGCGGTFAPSLFIGCFAGFLFARLWNIYNIGVYIPEATFALLGMAGVMAGVMHAPLTGMFLIAELTGGYDFFMPLMIVSVCSYLTISVFERHSIYGMRLANQGKLITHHTDHAVLTLMSLDTVIDKEYKSVTPETPLGKIVQQISHTRTNVLPVLDLAGNMLGEIDIPNIRHIMFRTELYHHFEAHQLMQQPAATLNENAPMTEVMQIFEDTQAEWLPVLDSDNHLKGYISKQRLYAQYRKMVADMSEE